MKRKAMKRRIRHLEDRLFQRQMETPNVFLTARVLLGPTGHLSEIRWPLDPSGDNRPLDLPAMGYEVRYVGDREPA